ncbi:hypothetical protein T4E_2987 [Trichinella pseudospiralis]|uniref:Uncharacterized protein n=1 Tax=Trichinella pseudospiralis TaxID=6337 RepID=A0A0V0XDV0_TRIPS|nr:hypothetical protein T4E_2987 [Trichinella pseudospiralis]
MDYINALEQSSLDSLTRCFLNKSESFTADERGCGVDVSSFKNVFNTCREKKKFLKHARRTEFYWRTSR